MSRSAFYSKVRTLFGGYLKQSQVDGIEAILAATENLPISYRAYLLATTKHETADTMQPITEYGGVKYFDKYDTGKLAADLGNTPAKDGDGYRFRGRGYVMITGYSNYFKAGNKLRIDLIGNPDLALQPTVSAMILVKGCTEGWFTSKKLSDYLPEEGPAFLGDYVNARRVVNGTDDANLIASYATKFEEALKLLPAVETPVVITPTVPVEKPLVEASSVTPLPSPTKTLNAIVGAFLRFLGVLK